MPSSAGAVPPPDFIFRLGSTFFSLAGSLIVFLGAVSAAPLRRVWSRWGGGAGAWRRVVAVGAVFLTAIAMVAGAYRFYQRREQARWEAAVSVWDQLAAYSLQGGGERSPWMEGLRRRSADAGPVYPAEDGVMASTAVARTSDVSPDVLIRSSSGTGMLLDVREDVERSVGYVPDSKHMRMGDLLNGGWRVLPADRDHFVFCDEGLRARYTVLFLLSRGLRATAVRGGTRAWRRAGGPWVRTGMVPRVFFERRFRRVLNTPQVRRELARGAVLVDARSPDKTAHFPLTDAVPISYRYTPRSAVDPLLARVPLGRPVVGACDTRHSCRDATLVGVELEKRGHPFRGVYARPWEMIDGIPFTGTNAERP